MKPDLNEKSNKEGKQYKRNAAYSQQRIDID